ncbi:hypothetical protein FBULB1_4700 [Fusarium bulbicola]|nr:hypothetical protein FBULB1_4700 [Fusarium bulbicola]
MPKRKGGTKQSGTAKRIKKEPGNDPNCDTNVADTANSCGTGSWFPHSPDHQLPKAIAFRPQPQPQPPRPPQPPRLSPAAPDALSGRAVESQDSKTRGREAVEGLFVSPFTVDEDRLIASDSRRYNRPENGQVNGPASFLSSCFTDPDDESTENATTSIRTPGQNELYRQKIVRLLYVLFVGALAFREVFADYTSIDIKNWCPGRSVLRDTNFWLKDLAPMHGNEGIMQAIICLAGIYIYDYVPDERLRQRINQRYVEADQNYIAHLNAPESREVRKGQEVITMTVLLSMLDVVLTERRRKKPDKPRWLEGFRQGEYFLQATDPGARYWKPNNVQYNTLRISQSIIVGRGVILAQPMMALPSPQSFNPEAEAGRFSWLLYGTEDDMFEVHGGCRLKQEPESTVVPITAKFLLRELSEIRQWSREDKDWELARKHPPTIDWARDKADTFIIDSNQIMTEVTAEAWRIAAIIYHQCRLLRLPRNHPEVLANLQDLACCIRIMPTSGPHFTAQAPLLPVFFLGLLATETVHKDVSMDWFEQVVQTPVRSSVPPLYGALLRIWGWIDEEVKIPRDPTALSEDIGKRYPWWEHFVAKVLETEEETLCLT